MVDLIDRKAVVAGKVDHGYVFVDGSTVGDITETSEGSPDSRRRGFHLGDRRDGLVTGKPTAGPEIQARGFAEDDTVFDDLKPKIEAEIEKAIGGGVDDMYQLQQVIRRWSASGSVTPTAAVR